ncbi:unnamed protein product [Brassica rapa subsp. trilocularis]
MIRNCRPSLTCIHCDGESDDKELSPQSYLHPLRWNATW